VSLELTAIPGPSFRVKTIDTEAFRGRVRHIQSVVCVVVGEQSLTAKGEEIRERRGPVVQNAKVPLVPDIVDRIRKAKAADLHGLDGRLDREPDRFQSP
jgi:hypothetical protein